MSTKKKDQQDIISRPSRVPQAKQPEVKKEPEKPQVPYFKLAVENLVAAELQVAAARILAIHLNVTEASFLQHARYAFQMVSSRLEQDLRAHIRARAEIDEEKAAEQPATK